MRFGTFQLIGERDAVSLADVQKIHKSGQGTFQPPGQKNLYSFETSINTTRIYIMTIGTEHRRKIESLGLVV